LPQAVLLPAVLLSACSVDSSILSHQISSGSLAMMPGGAIVLLALTLSGPGLVTGYRRQDVDMEQMLAVNETEVDTEDSEAEAPPCCSNPGCCQHARRRPKNKVRQCLTQGFAASPGCQNAAFNLGVRLPGGGGRMPGGGGRRPGGGGMRPGGGGMRPGGSGHMLTENEVCCMCAKAKDPKTWFPVPPNMWSGEDADFRSMGKCKSKCQTLCMQSGQSDFMNPTQPAGLTLGISLSTDMHADPQLRHLALTVFPGAGGCFNENYLGQIRSGGVNVIAMPDDVGNPWTGSFNNIC